MPCRRSTRWPWSGKWVSTMSSGSRGRWPTGSRAMPTIWTPRCRRGSTRKSMAAHRWYCGVIYLSQRISAKPKNRRLPDVCAAHLMEQRMMMKGKVGLVTGGGSGMGRAAALALAREGAHVVLAGRGEDKLVAVRDEIVKTGGLA